MSRMRILLNNGFYGLLLMHMQFALDETMETAATDGKKIYFSPAFLEELDDQELDFIMMHEILHIVLQHCLRKGGRDNELFNIACDIVVNSNILLSNDMDINSITLKKYGESMHLAPDGREGYEYTAEQVYKMLEGKSGTAFLAALGKNGSKGKKLKTTDDSGGKSHKNAAGAEVSVFCDDHTKWGSEESDSMLKDLWVKRFKDACAAIELRDPSNKRGLMPLFAKRILKDIRSPQTDWRTVLNDFVQEEITDYSFDPPDRRYDDSPFFMPDYNDKDFTVKDILFMIDTSGSVSDEMASAAYSEVKGAIDCFNGKLCGWLGFFDAAVIEPQPFANIDEFRMIKAAGGGGTDFSVIFKYVNTCMRDRPPACIIIITDGYAPFPPEKAAAGIPVLWIVYNDKVTPPWGKTARIEVSRK